MSILVVQLNHPGAEKPFKLGKGYNLYRDKLFREWNNDATHYRKFIQHRGQYLSHIGASPMESELLFWGEWEGNSWFTPLQIGSPIGIHQPFHSLQVRGHQNTDPYVFGNRFHYAVCKQRGRLTQLDPGSVILFGSSFKKGFALDTVFVVGSYESVHGVAAHQAKNYSSTYREATLEQLGDTYIHPDKNSNLRLYSGMMYSEQKDIFSYVPCKPVNDKTIPGFSRMMCPYSHLEFKFSSNPTGFKILAEGETQATAIWKKISAVVTQAGYGMGIFFQEPEAIELKEY
ncbi:MAG: hypothetical protein ACK5CV_00545 [Bacteroidota bacterium]|jgi:hypothetical protein